MTLETSLQFPLWLLMLILLLLIGASLFLLWQYRRANTRVLDAQFDNLHTLSDVIHSLAAIPAEYDELVETLYLGAAQLLETEFLQLGVFEADEFRTLIWVRDGNRQENTHFKLSEEQSGIVGWIRDTGSALLVHDFETEMDLLPAHPSYEAEDPPRSGIFVPVKNDHTVIGVLSIQSRSADTFSIQDLHTLSILADNVAVALGRIAAESEIEYRALQLVLLQETGRQLISLDPIPERIAHILALISQAFSFDEVAFYDLVDDELSLMTSSTDMREDNPKAGLAPLELVQQAADMGHSIACGIDHVLDNSEAVEHPHQLAMPLTVKNRVLGVVYIHCAPEQILSTEEIELIEMLAAQLAIARLEALNYTQQQEEAWITTVLLEVAKHASQPGNAEQALQAVLRLTNILTGTNWAMILLPGSQDSALRMGPTAGIGRQRVEKFQDLRLPLDALGMSPSNAEREAPIIITLPEPIAGAMEADTALALMLSDGENLLGVLLLEAQTMTGRKPSLLGSIGHQVSLRLENTRLIEEAASRQILERELAMAKSIQSSFLPRNLPDEEGWEFGVRWQSARQVGGDFYDFIPLKNGDHHLWAIVIADVADKGIPAALYMAVCRTLIRSVARVEIDPGKILDQVNQLLFTDTEANLFVSAFLAVLNPTSGELRYSNAGHNPPVLSMPSAGVSTLDLHGIVLGVMEEASYESHQILMGPGSMLVLYTDGVTEAFAANGDLFGLDRLKALLVELDCEQVDVARCIEDQIIHFCGPQDFSDDLTIITVLRKDTSHPSDLKEESNEV